ncbi:MAG: hypothetical protein HKN17_02340 [Rhodothermales bacterium]|nr:hypothetical protein [Rhodothermales bacterium]
MRAALLAVAIAAGTAGCGGDPALDTPSDTPSDTASDTAPGAHADVQSVIDRSIDRHGGDVINRARIEFDFRDYHFVLDRNDGMFSYERTYTDSTGRRHEEIINNDGIFKNIDGESVRVDSLLHKKIGDDVNSVAYFTLLPIPLNDDAVIKEDLGSVDMNGEPYRKIGITFRPEGGGRDYQDRFLVWIHENAHTMDYFAYYYFTDETGSRFRVADSVHSVGGARLTDYLNLTYDGLTARTIDRYDELWNADSLRLVSEVRIENVTVYPY